MGDIVNVLETKGLRVYHASNRLAFALSPSRTIFITPSTTSEILHTQRNSQSRYDNLRLGIQRNEYKDICELLTAMQLRAGDGICYRQLYSWEIEGIEND